MLVSMLPWPNVRCGCRAPVGGAVLSGLAGLVVISALATLVVQ